MDDKKVSLLFWATMSLVLGIFMITHPNILNPINCFPGRGSGTCQIICMLWGLPLGICITLFGLAIVLYKVCHTRRTKIQVVSMDRRKSQLPECLPLEFHEMEESLKNLAIEARARMMWGHPISEVAEWLKSQRVSPSQIEVIIDTSWLERNIEIRKLGIRDIAIGCISLVGFGLLCLTKPLAHTSLSPSDPPDNWTHNVLFIMIFLFLFGIWFAIRGIDRFFSSAKAKGSITEM